ncbi:MAG TPA: S8 family serine peptidase [Candidatus Binatia bacterium]|jgi:subtilisin family serine protease
MVRLVMIAAFGMAAPFSEAVQAAATADPAQSVIIELTDAPIARAARAGASAAAQRARVRSDVLALELANRAARGLPTPRSAEVLRYEYRIVANGFAATLLPETIRALASHPDVHRVVPDRPVEAILDVSVPLVRAPEVWSDFGYRGAGATIAIIDTGVDYLHPDLGGCFGPGCKVVGGFDFVNDDADPMDDHGHGTHVAATAAGDGLLVGVAPDAHIYAYKVLNSGGSGSDSTIIAGIERATDPDDDGDTSDHVDVISMSLGGGGDEDDPLSLAVDAATAVGVLSVIAAGNSAHYFTIGSPGTARTALTVGATDDTDQIAGFSSRGPTTLDFLLKPEITAPGVDICAARLPGSFPGRECIDDAHISISGTSMATPHVAGAAALVRGYFPSLSPADVKAILEHGAVPLGLNSTTGGSGRLDVRAAFDVRTALVPSPVNVGIDDGVGPSWSGAKTVSVRNLGASDRSYTLTFDGSTMPAGVSTTIVPDQVTVPAGGAADVEVTLTADNTVVPPSTSAPYLYTGRLVATTAGETESALVAFALVPVPANDTCANAVDVGPGKTGTSALATRASAAADDPESTCGCPTNSATLWYRVTPTQSGTVRVDATGSNYTVVLGVYRGQCGSLHQAACDDSLTDHHSRLEFQAQAGTPYYIQVASLCSTSAGRLNLEFDVPGAPPVTAVDPFTEIFALDTNDLEGTSLTFTPSGDSYTLCSGFATTYPNDPAGGTSLGLNEASFVDVPLAAGAKVALFGQQYDDVFVSSQGYVTFTAGETEFGPSVAAHFGLPTIAPFASQYIINPHVVGDVRWQQLADRAAVTWDNLQSVEFPAPAYPYNRIQLELFFDGRIRMSFVETGWHGLSGLSRGDGVPPLFQESNFVAVPHCRAPAGGELPVGGKSIKLRSYDPTRQVTKLKLVLAKMPAAVVPAPGSGGDPTVNGGAFELYNSETHEFTTIPLPAAGWHAVPSGGGTAYAYRDKTGAYGPCSKVDVGARGVHVTCGPGAVGFTLDELTQTKMAASVTVGTTSTGRRFCTLFTYAENVRRNRDGQFVASKAVAPGRCWLPESYYP